MGTQFLSSKEICSAFLHYAYQFPTTYYILWPFLCIVYVPQHFQSNWGATPHTHLHALHAVANVVQLGRYPIHAFACAPCCSKRNAIGGATPYTHLLALHAVANAVQLGRYPIHVLACAPYFLYHRDWGSAAPSHTFLSRPRSDGHRCRWWCPCAACRAPPCA